MNFAPLCADALSRLPIKTPDFDIPPLQEVFLIEFEHNLPLDANEISKQTKLDPLLSKIFDWVLRGWPSHSVSAEFKAYHEHRDVNSRS